MVQPQQPLPLFAQRLLLLRKRIGMTQVQLADHLGAGQATVSTWELGKSSPGVPEILALCALFRVSADYLVGRADTESGLVPGQWIVDEDAEAMRRGNLKLDVAVGVKVPRRVRLVDAEEMAALKKELRLK